MVERYFAVGELSPATVLIENHRLDFVTPEGRSAIEAVCKELATLPGVAEVRSVSRPLGKQEVGPATQQATPAPKADPLGGFLKRFEKKGFQALFDQADLMVRTIEDAHYVSTKAKGADKNHITRIDLVFKTDPFSPPSLRTLEAVREKVKAATLPGQPLAGTVAIGLSGSTALVDDLKRVTTSDERQMYGLVTLGVYVILVVLLRRPGICLYLIATVVLGYLASLGITEIVFRSLHTGPDPWPGLDWKVGFFLFVILVAVGEDYNIFLMSRVIEEERKHGPIEGTRRAVAHTGGIISSCGLIMAGTFGSMLAASLTALRELGFALGLGVLLDTFVVRPILVPAFVILIHRNRRQPPAPAAPERPVATEPPSIEEAEAAATSSPVPAGPRYFRRT
jgi:RND superfamily putative drug exporter